MIKQKINFKFRLISEICKKTCVSYTRFKNIFENTMYMCFQIGTRIFYGVLIKNRSFCANLLTQKIFDL